MLNLQQSLKLQPSVHMQQGVHILQTPIAELAEYLHQQILLNPFLDLDALEPDACSEPDHYSIPLSSSIEDRHSLFSYLMQQATQTFSTPEDMHIAQYILGNLSTDGLLLTSLEELSILLRVPVERVKKVQNTIQHFDPLGIASASLRDYWLLNIDKKKFPQAHKLIKDFYNHLHQCNFAFISRKTKLSVPTICQILKEALSCIPWSPADMYKKSSLPSLLPPLPDIYLRYQHKSWTMQVCDHGLPTIRINQDTLNLYDSLPKEERRHLHQHILSVKWLLKHLKKRTQTLLLVAEKVVHYQSDFLLGKSKVPQPLSVKTIAQELSFHESTIFRAIEHKVLSTPIGLITMKDLFPKVLNRHSQTSKDVVLQWIKKWIDEEDSPLSDADLSEKMLEQGISCSRRTVTKYREQLRILPSHLRKKFRSLKNHM